MMPYFAAKKPAAKKPSSIRLLHSVAIFSIHLLMVHWLFHVPKAFAHASERIFIVALPLDYYYAAAALVVLATFFLLLLSRRNFSAFSKITAPKIIAAKSVISGDGFPLQTIIGWLAFLGFFLLLAVGFFGSHDPLGNLLVLTIWTLLWVGITLLSVIFGNFWDYLNPWTAPVKTLRRLFGLGNRKAKGGLASFGYLPAIAGFFSFAWFEIASLAPDNPAILARAALIYWGIIFTAALYQGEQWLKQGEFFTVFYGFIGRIAPLWLEQRFDDSGTKIVLMAGLPASRIKTLPVLSKSGIGFLTLILASISFDGFNKTFLWLDFIGVNPLSFEGRSSVFVQNTIGLLGFWALTAGLILGVIFISCRMARLRDFWSEAGLLTISFLPIAAAYHIAHYFTALLANIQYTVQALTDPFGRGWDIFALGRHWVSLGFMQNYDAQLSIWNFQSGIIVIGHVIAIILTHLMSQIKDDKGSKGWGVLSHFPMALLMVFYTIFGLWLLSTPTGA